MDAFISPGPVKLFGLAWAVLDYDNAASESHAFWNLSRSFGDGAASAEQNPIHEYAKAAIFIVTLEAVAPEGKSRREKIWDVSVK